MCNPCAQKLEETFRRMAVGQNFQTPDALLGRPFTIDMISPISVHIIPQNITISRAAFFEALHYLHSNGHISSNPCSIESSNEPNASGPLCQASRAQNGNVRCINYILPILENCNFVSINSQRQNSVWLM